MFGRKRYEDDYDEVDENAIGGTFVPPQKLTWVDYAIAASVGLLAFVLSFALSYRGLHPAAWTPCAIAAGLRPPESLAPGFWYQFASALFSGLGVAKGMTLLAVLGKVALGVVTALGYLVFKALLSIQVRMVETNRIWSGVLSRCVCVVVAMLFLCADPVWTLGYYFSPTMLEVLLFTATVYLLLSFLTGGSLLPAYAAMFLLGLLGAETLLGLISLAGFWLVFYIMLRKGSLFHVKLLEPFMQQRSKWFLTFFWAIGLLIGLAVNIVGFKAAGGLTANDLSVGAIPLRYASCLWHTFCGAARYGAWIVGIGGTTMAFLLALSLVRRATDLEYFLNYHVGIVFFVVGVLAYSQMSSLSPLWFWTLGDVFVVPSALMLFLCALMCAVTVLCALAVTLVDAFCRDHRRLAAQINPDLDEEVARTHSSLRYLFPTLAFAVLTLLLLGGSLPGRVQSRTKEMLSLIDDYLREVVEETGDAKYLFTDGHFDCGLELESARRGGELVCIAAQPSPNARSGYALSSLMDDEHDRLSAAADGANLLRTWQRDRPERLERCALQVGLELWRQRSKLEYPSVSGVVARPGRSDDRARDEGIRRTLGIAERILKFYSGGEIPREAGTGVRDDFQFMQWRIARMARHRSEVLGFSGRLAEAKAEAQLSESLDKRNESLNRILQAMTRMREHTMRQMTPSEGLHFALLRADFPLAHRYADAILDSNPDDPDANFGIGMDYLLQEQYNLAEPYLVACLKHREKEPAIWNNLAILQYRQKRYEDALANANKALELAPDSVEVQDTRRKIMVALNGGSECDSETEKARLEALSREVAAKDALKRIKKLLDPSYDADSDADLQAGVGALEARLGQLRSVLGLKDPKAAEPQEAGPKAE